uniref:DEAD/DEAH box helicase n=1 Tax=uncultured Erythrobacter sp. TaxID=263913 RepID=UPI00262CE580|nr:DEAD/DEAH box helicase family protein [uncultured Erythrobacter sp.]
MAFRELDYQERALKALEAYLDALKPVHERYNRAAELIADDPDLGLELPHFPAKAWEALKDAGKLPASRAALPYSPRASGHGQPVPNATLKIPTGGGKTYLACASLSRIFGSYVQTNTGFVLWIVPNEAIYTQTLRTLRDRQHPYRQTLDRAAAGKVKVMEKGDPLNTADVEANLCIMVLMLQSSNRQNQDSLKLFQDRGDVHGFTPAEGEQDKHKKLLERIPNLSQYDLADNGPAWPMVKDSVGNALRIIRPVVVMDEGQKATSNLAFQTLYGFNPTFVLELSATPKDVKEQKATATLEAMPARTANVLVEVMGRELEQEGMIKMPLNIQPMPSTDWKDTLRASLDKVNALEASAKAYRADGGGYIRPILLVQAESTGADQIGKDTIHADDVKAWLLAAGLDEAEVALKTSEVNDLEKPENADLLSPQCRVRVIITKAALQEGWDCPFAYVLCSLAASSNESAMTQLVGRILRQPHATRTGVADLDECYVFTHRAETGKVVSAIKDGLERDGLGDLVQDISVAGAAGVAAQKQRIERRTGFTQSAIALPQVLWIEEGQDARELDPESDLFPAIDWMACDKDAIAADVPENPQEIASQIVRVSTGEAGQFDQEEVTANTANALFNPAYAVRMLADLVPNAYVARELVGEVLVRLEARGFDQDKIGRLSAIIIDRLRKHLGQWRDDQAAELFAERLDSGQIEFRIRGDEADWIMPKHLELVVADGAPMMLSETGGALKRSLFLPVYASELNAEETKVGVYLDARDVIKWWHRNGTSRGSYALRGWRRGRVYPDFVFAALKDGDGQRLVALESKGDQLDNIDTAYKRALLERLTRAYGNQSSEAKGKLELKGETPDYEAAVVLFSDMEARLQSLIEPNDQH